MMATAPLPSAEDFAFSRLIAYSAYQWPQYRDAKHHRLIARHLEAVERGEIRRLMITMPPRHGKSMLASEFFPAWYLGRNPDHYVVAATYAQDLADDFGRKVRNQIAEPSFNAIFPGVGLKNDSTSSRRFHVTQPLDSFSTGQNGAYFAVGVGGPLTGRGAHLLLIDDPVKNREEADSEVMRKKMRDWYTSTAYTRLMPGGRIVVIQCMTGDTPVLMADGTERPLEEIRAGDRVATYDDGALTSAKVLNWASQGVDNIFAINMSSGITVRANERHPFLVERDGGLEWTRLKNIRAGDRILRVIGESGVVSNASMTDAIGTRDQKAFAALTTTRTVGREALGLLQSILGRAVKHICAIATESASLNMRRDWNSRVGSVPSAVNTLPRMSAPTGARSCASIIATEAAEFAGCFATTATLPLVTDERRKSLSPPLNMFETEEVLSIEPAGREEVFDIQVEGTANFIANGLVSHNTRWHEDDLSGWLQIEHAHEGWVVLNLPAINDDGEALWPEQYSVDELERIKRALPARDWSALYQQQPQPDEGTFFKREWLTEWSEKPKNLRIYGTSDYAVTDGGGDFTVHRVWGIDPDGIIYRLGGWRGQTAADEWIDRKLDLIAKFKPLAWFGEGGVIMKAIEPMLKRRMQERKIFCRMEWLSSIHDKPTRARGFQARASMGNVRFEPGADISEFLVFPAGKYDDDVDTASIIGRVLDMAHPAIAAASQVNKGPKDRWQRALDRADTEEESWRTV